MTDYRVIDIGVGAHRVEKRLDTIWVGVSPLLDYDTAEDVFCAYVDQDGGPTVVCEGTAYEEIVGRDEFFETGGGDEEQI